MTLRKIGFFANALQALGLMLHQFLILRLGASLYWLPSAVKWIAVNGILGLASLLVLTIWFFEKKKKSCSTLASITLTICTLFYIYLLYSFSRGIISYLEIFFHILAPLSSILFGLSIINSVDGLKKQLNLSAILICISAVLNLYDYLDAKPFIFENSVIIKEFIFYYSTVIEIAICLTFCIIFLSDNGQTKRNPNRISFPAFIYFFTLNTVVICAVIAIFISLLKENNNQKSASNITQKATAIAARFKADSLKIFPGNLVRYRIMSPLNQSSKKKYPLVILLHHGGAHGTDNINQVESSFAQFFASYSNKINFPAFLFIPQCPKGYYWTSNSIDRQLLKTINHLESQYPIDTNRRYMVGLSEGGMGVWYYAVNHPSLLAAAVPISGPTDTLGASRIAQLPIWAFHGALDKSVPVQNTRDMINAIRSAGGQPRYTEFPKIGHNIADDVENTNGLLEWLFRQSKENNEFNTHKR